MKRLIILALIVIVAIFVFTYLKNTNKVTYTPPPEPTTLSSGKDEKYKNMMTQCLDVDGNILPASYCDK